MCLGIEVEDVCCLRPEWTQEQAQRWLDANEKWIRRILMDEVKLHLDRSLPIRVRRGIESTNEEVLGT